MNIPKIYEEQYSDYESGTDDPDSRTNLDQLKVRLSFDSALRSPSMCNVVDSTHEQEVSSSPRKHAVKFKSKSPQKQGIKLVVSEVKDKEGTRHHGSLKDKRITAKQSNAISDQDVVKRSRLEKRKSMIPISKDQIKKASHKPDNDKVDIGTRKQKNKMIGGNVAARQRRQKVFKKKSEASNTIVGTFATQSSSHIRPDSPPVPALAKKLASSTASSSSQLTDGNIKSPTILSKRTQRKVARRLDYKELPKPNSVVRMQQQQLQEPLKPEYLQQRPSDSPPVPTVAKKLQAHQLHKDFSTEFNGNKKPVLPPIADQNELGLSNLESDENTVPIQVNRRLQPVLPLVGETDQMPVEFKSNSPPVPALVKQISQQTSHSHGAHNTNNNERNRFMSSELRSNSRFTYFSEPDTNLTARNNPYYSVQPLQQVVYVPVSPQHFSAMYSQSAANSINMQSPQKGVTVPTQIVSPVPIMVSPPTLSPVDSCYPQNSEMNVGISKPVDNTIHDQSPSSEHHNLSSSNNEQSSVTMQHDHGPVGHDEPPLVVTTQGHQILHYAHPPTTSQLSQEKDTILQQLALMKKVCTCVSALFIYCFLMCSPSIYLLLHGQ